MRFKKYEILLVGLLTAVCDGRVLAVEPRIAGMSPDGSLLVAGDDSGKVQLRDAATGQLRRELLAPLPSRQVEVSQRRFFPAVSFSPNGKLLAVCRGFSCSLWSLPDGKQLVLPGENQRLLGFSPDGLSLLLEFPIVKSLSGRKPASWIRVWDVPQGRCSAEIPLEANVILERTVFSADGQWLAIVERTETPEKGNRHIRLWDFARKQEVLRVPGRDVTIAADGKRLLVWGDDGNAQLWDASIRRAIPLGE